MFSRGKQLSVRPFNLQLSSTLVFYWNTSRKWVQITLKKSPILWPRRTRKRRLSGVLVAEIEWWYILQLRRFPWIHRPSSHVIQIPTENQGHQSSQRLISMSIGMKTVQIQIWACQSVGRYVSLDVFFHITNVWLTGWICNHRCTVWNTPFLWGLLEMLWHALVPVVRWNAHSMQQLIYVQISVAPWLPKPWSVLWDATCGWGTT